MSLSSAFTHPTAFAAAGGGARSTPAEPTAGAQELVLPRGLTPGPLFATTDIELTATGELDEYDLFHSQHRFAMFAPATGWLTVWDLNRHYADAPFEPVAISRFPHQPGWENYLQILDAPGSDGEPRILSTHDENGDDLSSCVLVRLDMRMNPLQGPSSPFRSPICVSPPLHGRQFIFSRLFDSGFRIVDVNNFDHDVVTLSEVEGEIFRGAWSLSDDALLLAVKILRDGDTNQSYFEFRLYAFDGAALELIVSLGRETLSDDEALTASCSPRFLPTSPTRLLISQATPDDPWIVYRIERDAAAWRAVREKSFRTAHVAGLDWGSVHEFSPCRRFIQFGSQHIVTNQVYRSTLSVDDIARVDDGGVVQQIDIEEAAAADHPDLDFCDNRDYSLPRGNVAGTPIELGFKDLDHVDGSVRPSLALGLPCESITFTVAFEDANRARSLYFVGADRVVLELDGGDRRNFSLASTVEAAQDRHDIEAEALEQRTTHPQRGWFRGLKRPRIVYPCEIEEDEEFNLEYDEFLGREQRRNERRERERRAVRAAAGELTDEDEDQIGNENESGNGEQNQRQQE